MDKVNLLVTTMAEYCTKTISDKHAPDPDLHRSVQAKHLAWMSAQIVEHAQDWPATRLSRWLGFIQGAMMANRMLDLDALKIMFDAAKAKHGEPDEDLLDHLDPTSSFEIDIGGAG